MSEVHVISGMTRLRNYFLTGFIVCAPLALNGIWQLVAGSVITQPGELVPLTVMVPVGTPTPGAVTLSAAVTVTLAPSADGSGVSVTLIVVSALLIVCVAVPPLESQPPNPR